MNRKRIIMIAAVGLISFAGTFVFAWLTTTSPKNQNSEAEQPIPASHETDVKLSQPEGGAISTIEVADNSEMEKNMAEKQLKSLIYDVREKMQEYNNKLHELELREQRLQITQDMLKKDINELGNLRIELASMVASLKEQRDKLLKSRVEIAKTEKDNLVSIAATYDKMDPASASKILANMSQMQNSGGDTSGLDDVVKILHYMTERTKAKLLAELVTSEPKLAATLCQRLKQIVEKE